MCFYRKVGGKQPAGGFNVWKDTTLLQLLLHTAYITHTHTMEAHARTHEHKHACKHYTGAVYVVLVCVAVLFVSCLYV